MDTLTKAQRSHCMSRIRSKNTAPELAVRRALTQLGLRYRLHVRELPGTPDIVISKKKLTIFINGCFWHQHKGCRRKSIPKSNTVYWHRKLERNIINQKSQITALKKADWKTAVIWECRTKDEGRLIKELKKRII